MPRPPPSVSLGGSLRASRAAHLARPDGPLAAVDLADGRPLVAGLRDSRWVELPAHEAGALLPPPEPVPAAVPALAPAAAAAGRNRRRMGVVAAVTAAAATGLVALASALPGRPAPAVAGGLVARVAPPPSRGPRLLPRARGGGATALRPRVRRALPAPRQQHVVAVTPPVAVVPVAPPPPPLPELPAAPAL